MTIVHNSPLRARRGNTRMVGSTYNCRLHNISWEGKHTLLFPLDSVICSSECISSWPYPVGKEGAPSCWPGASTWQTAKCWVISCMSSKLKNALKQDLSARGKIWISYSLSISPQFSSTLSILYHLLLLPFNHCPTKLRCLNNLSDSSCPKGWIPDVSMTWK